MKTLKKAIMILAVLATLINLCSCGREVEYIYVDTPHSNDGNVAINTETQRYQNCDTCYDSGYTVCTMCDEDGLAVCTSCNGQVGKCTSCGGDGMYDCAGCGGNGSSSYCAACNGTGVIGDQYTLMRWTCNYCNGTGKSQCAYCSLFKCYYCEDGYVNCSACNNSGVIRCTNCNGTHKVQCNDCNPDENVGNNYATSDYDIESLTWSYYDDYNYGYDYSVNKTCSSCNGSGTVTCPSCDGKGERTQTKYTASMGLGSSGGSYEVTVECEACDGTGRYMCIYCLGDGEA